MLRQLFFSEIEIQCRNFIVVAIKNDYSREEIQLHNLFFDMFSAKIRLENVYFQTNTYIILLPKLFWPTVRKNCSSDREKLLKFKAEGWIFAKFLRSLEQFI